MSVLPVGFASASGVDVGDIGHSLRFRGRAVSAYANRTFGSPTSQNGWCWSGFVKLSEMPNGSNYRPLFSAGAAATSTWPGETLYCYQDGSLAYYSSTVSGTHNVAKRSTALLRDPSAWYHIFVRKTAAANSGLTFVRIWVNNVEITSWSANAYTGTQASVPDYINVNAQTHTLGRNFSEYLDGYLSRVCFVDNGASLLPTDFGYQNTEINEWVSKSQSAVKAVVDAGGTNSFMLDFDDGTTLVSELRSLGTNIGNGTTYGGLAAAFDGNTSQVITSSACTTGTNNLSVTVGKDWGAGVTRTIRKMRVYASSDVGFTNSTNKAVTFKLQGSTDNFSSSIVDLYSTSFTSSAGQVVSALSGIDTSTAYRYHRILITETNGDAGGHAVGVTEIVFSEDVGLGKDLSDKLNNWTLNNVSLTAGSTYDWMLDAPGNSYCTISPLMYRYSTGHCVYSYANLRATNDSGVASKYIWGTQFVSSGKWYWEMLVEAVGGGGSLIGVDSGLAQNTVFTDSVCYFSNGHKYVNNVDTAYGAAYTTGDIIGTALDKDANTVEFFKNGVSQGVISLVSTAVALGMIVQMGTSAIMVANFGQRAFAYTPPTGFKALCQANLPDPAILNPELHFDVRTRTGTAATYSVTDLLFQPDLAWIKSRGRAVDHALYDSVRGVQKQLESNQTGVETTETTGLTAFNSNGYTGGALDQINGTTATNSFVDWLWKAGGAAVTNNNGSISSQVSANVLAGQSVVTYIGTGVNATVGHGLGTFPSLVIHFNRDVAYDHPVWHKALLGTEFVNLNTTAAKATDATLWNSAIPTSTVINLGTSGRTNYNHQVAYCFAEIAGYSKVGSYTGNGSADGPFVHLGFKPKFVMIKRTDSTGSWQVFDSIRAGYNVDNDQLVANTSAAEVTTDLLDLTANGFKLRSTSTEVNASSGTYIFLAFADVPAKYSLAR